MCTLPEVFLTLQVPQTPKVQPDLTLSGKITQIKRQAGSQRQTTYTFRLTLTDPNTGLEVWTKVEDVTKQGRKDSIGF